MVNVGYTAIFDWLVNTKARVNFLKGGANSSKSYSIAQHLLFNKFYKENNKRILVVRKTTPAIRNSCYQLFKDLLSKYSLPHHPNKTELTFEYKNNLILFKGLDDPEKVKSSEYNYIWPEEATELTFNDYIQLNLRMRRETDGLNQMFLSFNPIDAQHWIKREVEDKPGSDISIHNSTYKDNPYASETDIKVIEDLINQDDNFYKVYALGEWGILKNIIYDGWKALTEPPKDIKDISYGIDWGFESPCALIKVYWLDGQKVVWEELIYKKGLTTPAFIEEAKKVLRASLPEVDEHDPDKKEKILNNLFEQELQREFYAGTDEPSSIQQFYEAGFNIHKAITDVRDGINYCKAHLLGLIGSNIVKEAQGYKRKEDKNGIVLEEPVKVLDHGMDAGRYGTFSIARNYRDQSDNLNFSLR
jgi:phage terminase large subunit